MSSANWRAAAWPPAGPLSSHRAEYDEAPAAAPPPRDTRALWRRSIWLKTQSRSSRAFPRAASPGACRRTARLRSAATAAAAAEGSDPLPPGGALCRRSTSRAAADLVASGEPTGGAAAATTRRRPGSRAVHAAEGVTAMVPKVLQHRDAIAGAGVAGASTEAVRAPRRATSGKVATDGMGGGAVDELGERVASNGMLCPPLAAAAAVVAVAAAAAAVGHEELADATAAAAAS